MNTQNVLIGIVGSYRKEGIIDTAISEIISEVQKAGIGTKKIYLKEIV